MTNPSDIKGDVIRKGDRDYARAIGGTSFNMRNHGRVPELIVRARDETDVAAAVRLAKDMGIRVGVCSGGHSWAANHVRDGGMVIDVSLLNAVAIDEATLTASAGPGRMGSELAGLLAKRRLFFPAGHCRGVCLGGYLLQGGFGWHSREVGPACESVTGIDYVDADGNLRHADAHENADMFWAARGAGPGFFGVVTKFHLKLYRRPKIIGAKFAAYTLREAERVFRWMHGVGRDVPNAIELMLLMSRHVPLLRGPGIHVVAPVFEDSWGGARKALSFMKTLPKGASYVLPFVPLRLSWMYAGVMAHYPHDHNYAVDNMWTHAPIDALIPGMMRIVETLPPAPSHMLWMNWAPPAKRTDMAYSMEDDIYIALYGVWKDPANRTLTERWAVDRMREMAPLATGVQLADENLGQRPAPFLAAANLARLDALRATHDPQGRFYNYMGRP